MSQLLRAGGFSPASALGGEPPGIPCAHCGSTLGIAWVHIASMGAVCRGCLPNPDNGDDGQRMADSLSRPPDTPLVEPDDAQPTAPVVTTDPEPQ